MQSGKRSETERFKDWLKALEPTFEAVHASIDDIARSARACEFSESVIRPWVTSQKFKNLDKAS